MHHGEPLDIIEFKRRFIRVRTAGGIAGWTENNQLLSPKEMTELRHVAESAATWPTQGVATTPEPLNVHTEPNRLSPSFLQIPEGGKMDVIGHKVTPRVQPAASIPPPPPKPRAAKKKKEKGAAKTPPPPPPPSPKLPSDWLALSRDPRIEHEKEEAKNATPPPPVHLDDWTMIRTKDGKVGWVLSRMLSMAIPDDVAQYAEGHRITSYFPLGDVTDDEGQVKHNWLWTTIGKGPQNYEFDSFRFFIWSKHHHRYETAFVQRDVVGHYPVEVSTSGAQPSFSVILEGEDGKLYKRTYGFNGYRVSLMTTEPYQAPGKEPEATKSGTSPTQTHVEQKAGSWFTEIRERLAKLLRR